MRVTDDPRVYWKALIELRQLLDETVYASRPLAVQDQHRSSKLEGGVDERNRPIESIEPASVFPTTPDSSALEQPSDRRPADGNSADSSVASGASDEPRVNPRGTEGRQ